MTTLVPRPPYSQEELKQLYPEGLQLRLVQVLLRHGERSPVSARFRNAGLAAHWPYCTAAKQLSSVVMTGTDSSTWDSLHWRRRLETFGEDDRSTIATGPRGEVDGVCQLGELTDPGRASTFALGQRLRHLYVDQLGFMPKIIGDADMFYLRATPMPRAIESLQQAFWGFYPLTARAASFPPPTIITRTAAEETLFPNESNCRRFSQLSRAFAQRTADRWNDSSEMEYLNKLISKWMPEDSPRVAVDSHPRLSGIMDTINSTLAHGPATRLPKEFYDRKARGIGGLVGELVSRMVGSVEKKGHDGISEVGGDTGTVGFGRGGEKRLKFALSGCHDTTLAAVLSSLGAFEGEAWPPYTSHIALELFQKSDSTRTPGSTTPFSGEESIETVQSDIPSPPKPSFWNSLFTTAKEKAQPSTDDDSQGYSRKPLEQLTPEQRKSLENYYVRIRYNDKPMTVPGCKLPGNHLEGDDSFCTLEAFKRIADKFTPKSWKQACKANIDAPAFVEDGSQKAGY